VKKEITFRPPIANKRKKDLDELAGASPVKKTFCRRKRKGGLSKAPGRLKSQAKSELVREMWFTVVLRTRTSQMGEKQLQRRRTGKKGRAQSYLTISSKGRRSIEFGGGIWQPEA